LSGVYAEGHRRRRWQLPDFAPAILRSIPILVRSWRERSRVRRLLAVMSERELQDMGTCRADIADEIGRPFWKKMKGRLADVKRSL